GIGRTSKEPFADCLILGWHSATSIVENIAGEKTESIVNRTDANLFMCRLDNPFLSHKTITISVPPLAESEVGFEYWMEKMVKLAQELSIPLMFVCDTRTQSAAEGVLEMVQTSVPFTF